MEYKEICDKIDKLDIICDEKISEFDKMWFNGPTINDSYEKYRRALEKYTYPEGGELVKLKLHKRLIMPYTLEDIPSYGDKMSLKEFISCCEDGMFIDYDGNGNYVKDGKMTDIKIYPSDIIKNNVREDFTEIVWFNK